MFQAAQVALETAGFVRPEWSHAGLHAAFANELTRWRKQFAPVLARDLTIVQELRHTANYRNHFAELEGKIAERCIDILVEAGVFLCTAVYETDK
jgi:hypothetical protein